MMGDFAIQAENITKIYRLYTDPVDRLKEALHPFRKKYHEDFYALKGVSFNIKKGETVGIIGKNGAGKSTLLKILTGVLTPTHGQFSTDGKILSLLELGTGFNPELSGIENVYFNGALLGSTRDEMSNKMGEILEFADIGDFVYQPVKTYSSGMYVRLAFSVIANMDADILIVDEALSVGDAFFVQKCMRFLRNFIENGTLIFVSHDSGVIQNLCKRAFWLNEGLLKADGSPKKLTEGYLAETYSENQGGFVNGNDVGNHSTQDVEHVSGDMRQSLINNSKCRNDLELFDFDLDADAFGKGDARIISVKLLDEKGHPMKWVVGGESVRLQIVCISLVEIFSPIIGFYVKDRLGQCLFGDNTFNFSQSKPLALSKEERFVAIFSFRMPILPIGDYSITAAIAEGTQQEHIQHHWIHDALFFKSHSSSVCTGLVGVPIKEIYLNRI